MRYRALGKTGLSISEIAFGAGPVAGLMTGDDFAQQRATVARAIELGVNWFDTAAGYGQGRSEESLGRVLAELGVADKCHVATKVRLADGDLHDIKAAVHRSVRHSLRRLQMPRVAALQLHNSVTQNRGDEPTSITPADAMRVLEAFQELRDAGLVEHFGLTGLGQPDALREVIRTGAFATIQVPYHAVNPSAGRVMPAEFGETNYDNLMADCAAAGVAVLAIRVFAGGALLDAEPSAHTYKTQFFPLDLYQRDRRRAQRFKAALSERLSMKELALRFVLCDPRVATVIIGFGAPEQIDEAAATADARQLPSEILAELVSLQNKASVEA